jgi:hypothetical protein
MAAFIPGDTARRVRSLIEQHDNGNEAAAARRLGITGNARAARAVTRHQVLVARHQAATVEFETRRAQFLKDVAEHEAGRTERASAAASWRSTRTTVRLNGRRSHHDGRPELPLIIS